MRASKSPAAAAPHSWRDMLLRARSCRARSRGRGAPLERAQASRSTTLLTKSDTGATRASIGHDRD
eukprot:1300382-Alexandrium_andersonii.AAC.1